MLGKLVGAMVRGEPVVYLVAPLLFESGPWLPRLCHRIAVVSTTPQVQLKRLMARNSLTEEAALVRISSQMPLEEKIRRADDVIDNNGTLEQLQSNVRVVFTVCVYPCSCSRQVAILEKKWHPNYTLGNKALAACAVFGAILFYLF
jgi:hypothetical protein